VIRQETMTKDQKVQLTRHIHDRIDAIGCNIAAFKAGSLPVSPNNAIGRLTRMEAINNCHTFLLSHRFLFLRHFLHSH
jgi:hypothetical protein